MDPPPINDYPSSDPPPKLRLMCSYGGHIIPRPHDKSLCYVGGDTRIVVSDRHVSLSDLTHRLSSTLLTGKSFSLKYQLPSEDLDSLISVTTDEDLENMIEEYDRVATSSGKKHPARIRLFLFTESKTETLIDNSVKSEEWFVSALNGSGQLALSESTSVNYLLGLDDTSLGEKSSVKEVPRKQDVHSVPDSPGLETSSSFGSTSSSPSTMNSMPIRADVEEQKVADVAVGIEEQKQENGGFFEMPPPVMTPVVVPSPVAVPTSVVDMVSPDSISSDNSLTNSLSRQRNTVYQDPTIQAQYQTPNQNQNFSPSLNRTPTPPTPIDPKPSDSNPNYINPSQFEQQIHQLNPQYQQPPHYIPTGSQYIPQGAVPGAAYYIVYPPQQHYPSTYISATPAQHYNIQSSYARSMAYPPIHHQSQSIAPSYDPSKMVFTQPMAPQMAVQYQNVPPNLSDASAQVANESFRLHNRAAQS